MKKIFIVILSIVFFYIPKTVTSQIITGKIIYKVSVSDSFSLLKKKKGEKTDTEALKNTMISIENGIKN